MPLLQMRAVQDAAVITRSLLIHSAPVVLFDSSSKQTFIRKTFVDWIGVLVDDLGHDLVVSTPAGVLTTRECVRYRHYYPILCHFF